MKFNWSKWGFWIGIVSFILAIGFFFLSPVIFSKKSNLGFVTISKSRIFTINEDVSGLSVLYNNEDLKKLNKNLTVFTIRVINNGNLPILKEYIDNRVNYGIIINNGRLVDIPDVVQSSNRDYFSNVVKFSRNDTIALNEFIFNPGEYFDVKFLVIHSNLVDPNYISYGKIANQSGISIAKLDEPIDNKLYKSKLILWIVISMSFILALTTMLYSTLKLKRRKEIELMKQMAESEMQNQLAKIINAQRDLIK